MTGHGGSLSAADPAADVAAELTVVGGNPTALEVAAVTAVLVAAVEEIDAEAPLDANTGLSAWQRRQRGLREPLHPGPGVWRGFGG